MSDMDAVTAAKSDQINADDLVGSEMQVTVEGVIIRAGTEQPVTVKLVGHDKVFRPCKTVARIMKAAWGADSSVYKGRSMLLYRDDSVTWGGMKVGGIRVRAISHITSPLVLALQEKKGSKKMTTVQPLKVEAVRDNARADAEEYVTTHLARVRGAGDQDTLDTIRKRGRNAVSRLEREQPDLYQQVLRAYEERTVEIEGYGRTDAQHGDQFDGGEA
jgi:hypothetical protein